MHGEFVRVRKSPINIMYLNKQQVQSRPSFLPLQMFVKIFHRTFLGEQIYRGITWCWRRSSDMEFQLYCHKKQLESKNIKKYYELVTVIRDNIPQGALFIKKFSSDFWKEEQVYFVLYWPVGINTVFGFQPIREHTAVKRRARAKFPPKYPLETF